MPEPVTDSGPRASDEVIEGNGEFILVVEDDDAVRNVTLDRLEVLGYTVIEARSGLEAIEHLKAGEPVALVFSDVVMTGYELAGWVRQYRPDLKVLLTSGYSNLDRSDSDNASISDIRVLGKTYPLLELAVKLAT